MSLHADESKHISFSLSQIERLCQVAKALSSPLRVKMIGLLASRSMNVNELAEALSMPVSTAALNVRQLEEAGLISTEIQPGIRGAMKLCSRRIDSVSLHLVPETQDGEPICQSWRQMVNIGYVHDGLIGSVQEQLRRAQKEIGFTYLRFHGIFDDDMHIYQENEDGSPWFNFAYADLLFEV